MPSRNSVKKLAHKVSTLMFSLLEVLGLPWTPRGPGNREKKPR